MNYCEKCKRDLPEEEKCPVCTPKKGVFLDIEMPKTCAECRFCIYINSETSLFCQVKQKEIPLKKDARSTECPLQEVKE